MFSDLTQVIISANVIRTLNEFIDKGGVIVVVISCLLCVMCYLILERLSFFYRKRYSLEEVVVKKWESLPDQKNWMAQQKKERWLSIFYMSANKNLQFVKAIVSAAPLLGLLGTVTGMISVFDALAVTGGGNTRAMAAGVSKATIPTMAGMVVALLGIFSSSFLNKKARSVVGNLENRMLSKEVS